MSGALLLKGQPSPSKELFKQGGPLHCSTGGSLQPQEIQTTSNTHSGLTDAVSGCCFSCKSF